MEISINENMSDEAESASSLSESEEIDDPDSCMETSINDNKSDNLLKKKLDSLEFVLRNELNSIDDEKERHKQSLGVILEKFLEGVKQQRCAIFNEIDEFFLRKKVELETSLLDIQPLQKLTYSKNQGIVGYINDMIDNFIENTENQIKRNIEFKKSSMLIDTKIGHLKELNSDNDRNDVPITDKRLRKLPRKIISIGDNTLALQDNHSIVNIESECYIAEENSKIYDFCHSKNGDTVYYFIYGKNYYKCIEITVDGEKIEEKKLIYYLNPSPHIMVSCLKNIIYVIDEGLQQFYIYRINEKELQNYDMRRTTGLVNFVSFDDTLFVTTCLSIYQLDCKGKIKDFDCSTSNRKISIMSITRKLLSGYLIIKGDDCLFIVNRKKNNAVAISDKDIFEGFIYHDHTMIAENKIKFILSEKKNPRNVRFFISSWD